MTKSRSSRSKSSHTVKASDRNLIKSIYIISSIVHNSRRQNISVILLSLHRISKIAERLYKNDKKRYRKEIYGASSLFLGDIDPLNNSYNFISFSKFSYYEPEWTQFIANCLKEKEAGRILWKAICDTVCDSIRHSELEPERIEEQCLGKNIIGLKQWETLPEYCPGNIRAEQRTMEGIPDITFNVNNCNIIIENKIAAPQTGDQLARYKSLVAGHKNVGLVYLTLEERREEAEKEQYINITYEKLGKNIREHLARMKFKREMSKKKLLDIFPLLVLLNSIEKDLYGHSIDSSNVGQLLRLAEYLRREEKYEKAR